MPNALLDEKNLNSGRFISFRFDDGFITGARKAIDLLSPDKASFFLVTCLLGEPLALRDQEYFDGPDFGSITEWSALSEAGHDIQPHGHRHLNFAEATEAEQIADVGQAIEIIGQIHNRPRVFCFPYNAMAPIALGSLGLSAAGFRSATSDGPILFNRLDRDLDMFALRSWAVRERHLPTVLRQLEHEAPERSWTILAFHSLDGEGHEPWSSAAFGRLVHSIRSLGFHIRTIGQMVEQLTPL